MTNIDCSEKISADDIAEKALSGEAITQYFTNRGVMNPAVHLITVDIGSDMLSEIDNLASEMNISRQAIIKVYLRQSLKQSFWITRINGSILKIMTIRLPLWSWRI